jgi:AcrR family transcriptional regulator
MPLNLNMSIFFTETLDNIACNLRNLKLVSTYFYSKENILAKEIETTSGRMTGDERREQILHIAIKLFSRNGFSGTTTKKIAAEAGISEAMVFRHFTSKDELYHAILDYKACEGGKVQPLALINEVIKSKNDYEVFYQLALNALNHHQEDPEFMRLLLHSALEGHELAEMFISENIVPLYEVLSFYISQRQRDGVFRNMTSKLVVRAFVGMMIHHSLFNTLWDKQGRLLKISNEDAAKGFTEILLNGIKK